MPQTHPNATPVSTCPACGYVVDAATSPKDPDARPKPDDFSVCLRCAAPLVFTIGLTVRAATPAELESAGPELRAAIRRIASAIRTLNARRN